MWQKAAVSSIFGALNITVVTSNPLQVAADLAVFGVFTLPKTKAGEVPLPLRALDTALGGGLAKLLAKEDFTGKRDQTLSIPTLGKLPFDRVILYGLGDRAKLGNPETRVVAAKAARAANGEKATSLLLALPDGFDKRLRYVAEGLDLGAYRFSKYLTGERAPKSTIATMRPWRSPARCARPTRRNRSTSVSRSPRP